MTPGDILKVEGFIHIYGWHDEPGQKYAKHAHRDKVAIFIERGEVSFSFADGSKKKVMAGERFDVPTGLEHEAEVGSEGCDYIVGEMIEGDS